ncbi:MAG: Myo-inositol-monophosphatase [Candidatus Levybacteria bacterium GW2011_GWB1_41_21]|nr:MAG: Myo-inositol-monophosphatase [Candidatus Levybacteria bacterium GW2011_GWB1_41_21]
MGLARQAGEVMRKDFSLGMKKEWKKDKTPVTVTDTFVNRMVINAIGKEYPEHSILGEEENSLKDSEYVWVCDPIDGTIPFSHGFPIFAFSLALVKNGSPVLGVIYDPIVDRLLYAEKNKGTTLNGKPVKVSSASSFSERTIIDGGIESLKLLGMEEEIRKRKVLTTRIYSCVYGGMLVALGEFVAEIYRHVNPWDAAAVKIVVEEAGGKVTDLLGNEQRYDQPINGFIASNGRVHDELVKRTKKILKESSF